MTLQVKRILGPLAAAALAGGVLPVTAGAPARAEGDAAFSGYSASAWAAPVKIEIYEPTIPIPADPQLEVELAYTKVEADSGSSAGRASWLWPGDPVGEGLKTFVEQLGLPPQLGENGYPIQVNAARPGGAAEQSDQPLPGMVMATRADERKTVAQAGFSPDGDVHDGSETGGQDRDEGTPGVPGLPGIPDLSGVPGLHDLLGADALQQFGQAITGSRTAKDDDAAAPSAPGLPPELAGLVDVEGYTSSSRSVAKAGKVVTTARSALGDVSLLGGLVTLDGLVVTSSSSSNGTKGAPAGKATIGGLSIAGQVFRFGPDGLEAAGQQTPVPGLPDQAAQALKQLGIKLKLPKAGLRTKGDRATSTMAGLVIDLDTAKLRRRLDALPIDALIDAIPAQAGQLKSLLQTVAGLSPRVVLTLGNASTEVDTVQGIDIPTDIPDNDPGTSNDGGGGAAGGGGGGGGTPASGGAPTASTPTGAGGSTPSADGDLGGAELAGSGLPPLYSIPGAVLAGGIALAAVGGTWLRRAGVLALGGAGSCSHGLDSGLPDLRKA